MALDPRRRVPTTFNVPVPPKPRSSVTRAVAVGPRSVRRSVPRNPRVKRRLDSVFDEWQYKKRKYTGAPSGTASSGSRAIVPVGSRSSRAIVPVGSRSSRAIVPVGSRSSRPSRPSRPSRSSRSSSPSGPSGPSGPSRKRSASRSSSGANMNRVISQMADLTQQYDRMMKQLTQQMRNIEMRDKRTRR